MVRGVPRTIPEGQSKSVLLPMVMRCEADDQSEMISVAYSGVSFPLLILHAALALRGADGTNATTFGY